MLGTDYSLRKEGPIGRSVLDFKPEDDEDVKCVCYYLSGREATLHMSSNFPTRTCAAPFLYLRYWLVVKISEQEGTLETVHNCFYMF